MSFDASTESGLLYRDSDAFASVMWKQRGAKKPRSQSYKVFEIGGVLERCCGESHADVYQSQNWFSCPSRQKAHLEGMATSFFDADYYKYSKYQGKVPLEVSEGLLAELEEKGYPLPSSVICSGQGVYVKWYFSTALGRENLPFWDLLQIRFLEVFRDFGADPASRDASRVLRVLGTYNQKNGGRVEALWVHEKNREVVRYDFWELFDAFGCSRIVKPSKQFQLVSEMPTEREAREIVEETAENREMLQRRLVSFARRGLHVVSDLKKLASLRGWDREGIPDGQRDLWLFWLVNHVCLAYMTSHDPRNYHEALAEAAPFIPQGWSWAKFCNKVSAIYQKVQEMASGCRWLSFGGKVWPLYYTPSNERLCEDFKLTPFELQQLDYIRTEDTRAAQQKRKRQEQGMLERGEYLAHAQERRDLAKVLCSQGKSLRQIADAMSTSMSQVKRLLNN